MSYPAMQGVSKICSICRKISPLWRQFQNGEVMCDDCYQKQANTLISSRLTTALEALERIGHCESDYKEAQTALRRIKNATDKV